MTLWELKKYSSARIQTLSSNLSDKNLLRLRELGFDEGEEVACLLRTPFGGPRIYRIAGNVFSLTRDVGEHIIIHLEEAT